MNWLVVNSADNTLVDVVTTTKRDAQRVLDFTLRTTKQPHHLVELADDVDHEVIDLRAHAHLGV